MKVLKFKFSNLEIIAWPICPDPKIYKLGLLFFFKLSFFNASLEFLWKLSLICTYPPQHCPIPGPRGILRILFFIFLFNSFFASSIIKYSKFPPPIVPKIVSWEINIISSILFGDDPLTSKTFPFTISLLKFILWYVLGSLFFCAFV